MRLSRLPVTAVRDRPLVEGLPLLQDPIDDTSEPTGGHYLGDLATLGPAVVLIVALRVFVWVILVDFMVASESRQG